MFKNKEEMANLRWQRTENYKEGKEGCGGKTVESKGYYRMEKYNL